jgi:uncharacterized OsmC-like protein
VHESRLAKHAERGNICVKLAANNTSIQQDLDKVKTGFKALKHHMRTLSRQTISSNVASDSLEVSLQLAKTKYGLNLVGSAKMTLVEGVKRMPAALRASFAKKDLVAAAVMTGRIDSKYNQFPNGKVIIEGVKCDITGEEWKKIESTFTKYHLETTAKGMIAEKSYDDDGFIHDKALNGDEFKRDFGISQEQRQRCKILSHPTQRAKRKAHAEKARLKALILHQKPSIEIGRAIALNKIAEEKLHALAGRDASQIGGNS